MVNEHDDLEAINPMQMFVCSSDSLRGRKIDQTLPPGWTNKPPLFQRNGKRSDDSHVVKSMVRKGIPPALRSAVWLIMTVRQARTYQTKEQNEEFGTLKKVEILDHGWNIVKSNIFPDTSDEDSATIPDFGIDPEKMESLLVEDHCFDYGGLSKRGVDGVRSLTFVLSAVKENLGVEYCPLLPDLVAIYLSVMTESYAYASIREMSNTSDHYFPMSKVEHFSWCKTFADIMGRLYPQTAAVMSKSGVMTPSGLDPIFRRFFITILPRDQVLRIVDIYVVEGYKTLFRIGSLILCLSHHFMNPEDFKDPETFWTGVKRITHSENINFEASIKQAYGSSGRKRYRSRRSFPRRRFINKLLAFNEKWAEEFSSDQYLTLTTRPLGFVEGNIPIVLAKKSSVRLSLANFLPTSYKSTKIELIYSSNTHGRSIGTFYKHCARSKKTIVLLEVLQTGATIGMFASDTWRNCRNVYGDGECTLFRLFPNPECYHWKHELSDSARNLFDGDDSNLNIKSEAALGQFMMSGDSFISMGNNQQGLNGLWLNEDLSKGSSAKALGFNNEPLAGLHLSEFDVGLVEVYHLLREVDGKAIDACEEDIWKGMFD